ncbi:protein of unknown function [Candidatus Nitrosocosmicus franklandus]|uniref:Uncharacterized protein n=1 Tax=Candidatus Nitrosocosmicus franklandianus TaxID=1798806 RepID=A0A484IDB4_9ARCH|nr:protein of unknown function [Candidatus Nitrosocosmicus franklandus]
MLCACQTNTDVLYPKFKKEGVTWRWGIRCLSDMRSFLNVYVKKILKIKKKRKKKCSSMDIIAGKSITTQYSEGINIKHPMASSSILNSAYEEIDGHMFWEGSRIVEQYSN